MNTIREINIRSTKYSKLGVLGGNHIDMELDLFLVLTEIILFRQRYNPPLCTMP